jgi:predicted alpha/beta-fold hydrolase
MLPASRAPALLTEDLIVPEGRPRDVFVHFGINPDRLASLRGNWDGLTHTAQATGADSTPGLATPHWPDYEDIWIPVDEGVEISGRLGLATANDKSAEPRDCIVILPGLLGDNNVLRTRDLCDALRTCGFHALALEFRGHGRTLIGRPDLYYGFAVLETIDLLAISRWLEEQPYVRRTGLIGFCWGANHALIAAWYDSCRGDHVSVNPALRAILPAVPDYRHYSAGVMALSPVLRFEELIAALDKPWSKFKHPVLSGLQTNIRTRMAYRRVEDTSGSLRRCILHEFFHTVLKYEQGFDDSVKFLRLLPYQGLPDHHKLEKVRVPLVIVFAANDPLSRSQDVADLIATTGNPNVGAVVLPGGGHVGFAPYAKPYYYSLILNFFSRSRA